MRPKYLYILIILIAAAALRFYHLTSISLWHDEAFSALLIKYPWHEMFYRIGLDVHPPMYYIALRLWYYIFGWSLLSLRGFSAFFGIATVYATYLFVRNAFKNENLALAAALVMAVSPFQVQYVTEARMYTFGTFLLMISAYFLVKALQWQSQYFAGMPNTKTKTILFWLFFALATSAAMYTHYYLFFSVLALGLYALYMQIKTYGTDIKKYLYFVGSYILVLLLYIPWIKTFIFQFSQVQANYWIPKANIWSVPITVWEIFLGTGVDINKLSSRVLVIVALLFSLWAITRFLKKQTEPARWLVALALVVPFLGALALSIKQSIFLDRYFLFAALFYTVLVVTYIYQFRWVWLRWALITLFVVISLVNGITNTNKINAANGGGMQSAANYLNNNVAASDKLFVDSSFEYFNFKYYNKTGHAPLLYTGGSHITDLPHFSGTALLTENDLLLNYNNGAKKGDTVWILWTNAFGRGDNKPEVPKNWAIINERSWQDVRPYPSTSIIIDEYKVK